jgi:phosphate transport system substrate-binding protein
VGAVLAWALAAGCANGTDVDPRQIPVAGRPDMHHSGDDRPVPVAASLQPRFRAAAPLAETRAPEAPAADQMLRVALGRHAAHAFGDSAEKAFATAWPGATVAVTVCLDQDPCELLLAGRADLAVIAGGLSAREQDAGLRQVRLGFELFALVVPADSPVRSLTSAQVRQVLTGEARTWSQLGFDGGEIVVVGPADAGTAERAERALMPGDRLAESALRAASERHVAAQLLQHKGAIGIVQVTDAPLEADMKAIQIDWCSPTADAFSYGTYPAGLPIHVVTPGPASADAMRLLEFSRSAESREVLSRTMLVR